MEKSSIAGNYEHLAEARNPKVWVSMPGRKLNVILCLVLVAKQITSTSSSLPLYLPKSSFEKILYDILLFSSQMS